MAARERQRETKDIVPSLLDVSKLDGLVASHSYEERLPVRTLLYTIGDYGAQWPTKLEGYKGGSQGLSGTSLGVGISKFWFS